MKFERTRFSKRYPPVDCAVVTFHEKAVKLPELGGLRGTGVAIVLTDGSFYVGVSLCSLNDPFVKATGRQKALGRAVQWMYASAKPSKAEFTKPMSRGGWLDFSMEAPNPIKALIAHLRDEIRRSRTDAAGRGLHV